MSESRMRSILPVLGAITLTWWLCVLQASANPEVERAIRAEIADFSEARSAGDVDRVVSHVADDARLVSFTGREITKAEYRAAVRRNVENPGFRGMGIKYRVTKIEVLDATSALVEIEQLAHKSDTFTQQGWEERNHLRWKFEKRGERWLIVWQEWVRK